MLNKNNKILKAYIFDRYGRKVKKINNSNYILLHDVDYGYDTEAWEIEVSVIFHSLSDIIDYLKVTELNMFNLEAIKDAKNNFIRSYLNV